MDKHSVRERIELICEYCRNHKNNFIIKDDSKPNMRHHELNDPHLHVVCGACKRNFIIWIK